jgi:AbiV family abortive infection protein
LLGGHEPFRDLREINMTNNNNQIIGVSECIVNAMDLLESAKILFRENKFNPAYHLAALALEEIGKSELILIHQISPKEDSKEWSENQLGDHVKKLFWSFFGSLFGNQKLTNELLENTKGLAQHIHDTRLKGLYVDLKDGILSIPQNLDYKAGSEKLIGFVESRLNEKIVKNKYTEYENDSILLPWFLKATDDSEKRKFIRGNKSMEKLVELGDVRKWIGWLKNEYDNADEESRKLLVQELQKQTPKNEYYTPKWKVKFRLYSDSHSIKQKNLNEWNKFTDWIKLTAVSDKNHKNEILVDVISPKVVKIDGVFKHCWYVARVFTVSINMGSLGFFWWDLPKFRNKYYENAFDMENRSEFSMEIHPSLKIDWKKDVLTENDLKNIAICYTQILKMGLDGNKDNSLNYYFGGLTYLGLNDLNYRCEDQSYINFYLCLKKALNYYGLWKPKENYYDIFYKTLKGLGLLKKDIDELFEFGENILKKKSNEVKITLEEVASMKIVCDAFYIKKFSSLFKK